MRPAALSTLDDEDAHGVSFPAASTLVDLDEYRRPEDPVSAPLELRRDDIHGDGDGDGVHLHGRYVGRVSRLSPGRARWAAAMVGRTPRLVYAPTPWTSK